MKRITLASLCFLAAVTPSVAREVSFNCVADGMFECSPTGCKKNLEDGLLGMQYRFKFDPDGKSGTVETCRDTRCGDVISQLQNVKSTPEGGFRSATGNFAAMGTVPFEVSPTGFTYATASDGFVSAYFGRCGVAAAAASAVKQSTRETVVPRTPSDASLRPSGAMVQAIAVWWGRGAAKRGSMFIKMREKTMSVGGGSFRVICAADNPDWIIANAGDNYFAINAISLGFAIKGDMWIVVDGAIKLVIDSRGNADAAFLQPHGQAIIDAALGLCPEGAEGNKSFLDRSITALKSGEETYNREARRLGLPSK